MWKEQNENRQIKSWTLSAFAAPLVQTVGGIGWETVLVTSIVCSAVMYMTAKCSESREECAPWLKCMIGLWAFAKICYLLPEVQKCWQVDKNNAIIPYILIFLAGWMVTEGIYTSARVGAILSVVIAVGIGTPFISAADEIRFEWLKPDQLVWSSKLTAALLLPMAGMIAKQDEKRNKKRFCMILTGLSVAMAVLINGVLSKNVAQASANGLYEVSRTVSILSIAKRFESIVATACLLSWFLMLSLYLKTIEQVSNPEWNRSAAWAAAAAGMAALYGQLSIKSEVIIGLDGLTAAAIAIHKIIHRKKGKRG